MSASRTTHRPAWADDDRLSRIALSRLIEPGDAVAGALIAAQGLPAVVDAIIGNDPLPPTPNTSRRSRSSVEASVLRWRVRLPGLEPERDVVRLARLGGRVVVPGDPEWPVGLGDLQEREPLCLWVRGADLARACASSVAIVGSRSCSPYGERVAEELGASVTERGVLVISGGAFGIDAAAHRGALVAAGGTVGVLACGVDRAYPKGNEALLEAVLDCGTLVSEVALGCSPSRWRFLERNRLIAAMSGATVVVEAALRSGALSTARKAAALGRPVGAVPGPITSPTSAGCHELMRTVAATCVTDADEVVELIDTFAIALSRPVPARARRTAVHDGLAPHDLRVYDALALGSARPLPSLAQTAGLTEVEVEACLGRLDLRGLAQRSAGGWRRAPRARGA